MAVPGQGAAIAPLQGRHAMRRQRDAPPQQRRTYRTKHAISADLIISSGHACSETMENEAKIL